MPAPAALVPTSGRGAGGSLGAVRLGCALEDQPKAVDDDMHGTRIEAPLQAHAGHGVGVGKLEVTSRDSPQDAVGHQGSTQVPGAKHRVPPSDALAAPFGGNR